MKTLILLILIVGCSSNKAAKKNSSTVDVVPAHDKNGSIVIDTDVDPVEAIEVQSQHKKYKLFFISGAYDAFVISDFFKKWEEKKLIDQTESVSSFGLGALIVALYADGGTTNLLDWKLFKLRNKIKNISEIYSEAWVSQLEEFIDEEFQNKEIKDLKIKMVFHQFEDKINNLKEIDSGKVAALLKKEINQRRNGKSQSLMWSKTVSLERLNRNFEMVLIGINTAPRKLEMKNPDGYIWGLLTRKYSLGRDYQYKIELEPEIEFVDNLSKNFSMDADTLGSRIDETLLTVNDQLSGNNE